jgi:small nuclear ribonucleoprotein (snRNP)-like protein
MLVELKDGENLNGHLVSCDTWMNLVLREVVQTSPEGDRFFRLPEVYVRGNNVTFSLQPVCPSPTFLLLTSCRSNTCASQTRLLIRLRNSSSSAISQTVHPGEVDHSRAGEIIKEEEIGVDEVVVATGDEEEDDLHEP